MKTRAVLCVMAFLLLAIMTSAQATQRDFLLLDNGDKILVNFPAGSHGSIQVKSLSARARVDIENTAKRGFDKFMVTAKDGWKAYPGNVDGANIAITLREAQDNKKDLATSDLPFDSDAVVRIVNSAAPRIAGGDNRKRGTRCPVDSALLEW
jgi:Skp family chaperone for outer membrane proteins